LSNRVGITAGERFLGAAGPAAGPGGAAVARLGSAKLGSARLGWTRGPPAPGPRGPLSLPF